jgi:hypothetical protein
MLPEAAKAIELADKHLYGESAMRRAALAKDIVIAIKEHAERMAIDAIKRASAEHSASVPYDLSKDPTTAGGNGGY